jgi:hypothetical protein
MDILSASLNLIAKSGFTSFQASEICKLVEKYFQPIRNDWIRVPVKPFCCGGVYK